MPHCAADLDPVRLAARYRYWMGVATLIFVGMVAAIAVLGWQRQLTAETAQWERRVQETALRLQSTLKAAHDHVLQLRRWVEDYPHHAPFGVAHEVAAALRQVRSHEPNAPFSLDALEVLPPAQRLGQILALPSAHQPLAPGYPSGDDLAAALLSVLGSAHQTWPYLQWSYFVSANADLLALYPWISTKDFLGETGTIAAFLREAATYDIYRMATPTANPLRKPYWTPPYRDQLGTGWMITHGAPVYWGEHFIGYVATDVRLAFLEQFLNSLPAWEGRLLVVSRSGQVLGEKGQPLASQDTIPHIKTWLPEALRSVDWVHPGTRERNGYRVHAVSVDPLDATLLAIVPKEVLYQRVWETYRAPFALILLLIGGAWGVQWLLWRWFVAPALVAAALVGAARNDQPVALPDELPRPWRSWFAVLQRNLKERADYLAELLALKAELEARVVERTRALDRANRRLALLVRTDPLTRLANRRQIVHVLLRERRRCLRSGETLAILLLDLDHFKAINDRYGHLAGDAVLREFARRIVRTIRATDTAGRLGGEEFLVVLPSLNADGAFALAERIRRAVADTPFVVEGQTIPVTVSIGVACYRPGETLSRFLDRVDACLYAAKAAGRNRVVRAEATA